MLFISYSSNDREFAEELLRRALDHGYAARQVFLDSDPESGLRAGEEWEHQLYNSLKQARAMFVLCSRNWLASRWCFIELGYARAMAVSIFPIRLERFDISDALAGLQAVDLTPSVQGSSREAAFQRLWTALDRQHLGPQDYLPWPPEPGLDACPFPGLPSFDERLAPVYFGREQDRDAIVRRLKEMRTNGVPRLLVIAGGSGSGKSSVLRAGVLPWLRHRAEQGEWVVLPAIRYGAPANDDVTMFGRLAELIAGQFPKDDANRPAWRTLRADLESEDVAKASRAFLDATIELGLTLQRRQVADVGFPDEPAVFPPAGEGPTTLIAIDQFEELLVAKSDKSASRFLRFLQVTLSRSNGRLLVVGTLRSDYLDIYEQEPEALEPPFFEVYRLAPFPWDRVRSVIVKPADRAGVKFSEELVDRLEADAPTSDTLPLLAFTLERLYRVRPGNTRELGDYEAMGGIEGSVRQAAEQIVPPNTTGPLVDAVRAMFVRHLVTVNEKDTFVRRTAHWSDLDAAMHQAAEKFVSARLITKAERNGGVFVEVAHEAIFRCWGRLNGWLRTYSDVLRWRDDVIRSRTSAESAGKKWSGLTTSQLAVARGWPTTRFDVLTAEESRWIRDAVFRQKVQRGVVTAIMTVIAGLALVAWILKLSTDHASQIALARYLASQAETLRNSTDGMLNVATLLAIEASRRDPSAVSLTPLRALIDEMPSAVATIKMDSVINTIRFSPVGPFLAIGGNDGKVRVWDYSRKEERATLVCGGAILNLWFSPDGEYVAVHEGRSPIRRTEADPAPDAITIWKWRTSQSIRVPSPERIRAFVPVPGEKTRWLIVTDNTFEQWDERGRIGSVVREFGHSRSILRKIVSTEYAVLAVSHSTEYVAVAQDTGVALFDAATGRKQTDFPSTNNPATVLAFSPDDSELAIGKQDGITDVWDWKTKKLKGKHEGSFPSVLTFNYDGSLVAEIDRAAGTITFRLWRVDSGNDLHSIDPSQEPGGLFRQTAIFTRDSRRLVLCLGDRSVQVLHIPAPDSVERAVRFTTEARLYDVALDPSEELLATASEDGRVTVWRLSNGRAAFHFADAVAAIPSPTGKYLGLSGRRARLVDVETGRVVQELGDRTGPMAFSPDGTRFVIGGSNGAKLLTYDFGVHLRHEWDDTEIEKAAFSLDNTVLFVDKNGSMTVRSLKDGREEILFSTRRAFDGEFSFDRKWFAEKELNGPIHLYDVELRREVAKIASSAFDPVIRLSRNGKYMASRVDGRTMAIWELQSQREVMRGKVSATRSSIAFDKADRILAFSDGADVQVWDLTTRKSLLTIRQEGGEISALAFSPDGKYLAGGCKDKKVRIWKIPEGELAVVTLQEHDFDFGSGTIDFTADGKFLIVQQGFDEGPYGHFVRLILWRPEDIIRDACGRLLRSRLELPEWTQYLKGQAYRDTCEGYRTR